MAEAPFRVEEATIEELHAAIRAGRTTCVDIVQQYIARARAYNGVCSLPVTEDGAPVPEAEGTVRAGAPLRFPTETVKAAEIFPDLDKYQGPPLEFGRMERTTSDAAVEQQYGMIAGTPDAGQLNALATLNIRGERSVTCKGEFDRHPSLGPLPPGAPAVCDQFRHCPTRSNTPPSSTPDTAATHRSTRCRCTGSSSRSRTRSTPRTCGRPRGETPPTTSISRRATTSSSSNCATRGRSSSPRR